MSSKQRLKNTTHSRPVIYGSHATLLKPNEKRADPSHTHKWTVYLRGIHNEDLSFFIKKVQFKLHESFENPVRTIDSPPFEVHETGWGEFDIPIKMTFNDWLQEKSGVTLIHTLQLYPKEDTPANSKVVVAEHYDEIVFNEPFEEAYKKLTSNPPPTLTARVKVNHNFTPHAEQDELRRLQDANEKVLAQIAKEKARLQAAEEEQENLKKILGDDA